MKKGKLIVIEGACDGIGKTTQYELLKKRLEAEGNKVITHHFPTYHSDQGRPVELYLQGEFGKPKELSPYFVNSLYAIDRAITWKKELQKEYKKGNIILLDRYTTSSIIYQASVIEDLEERKQYIDYVCDFEYKKLGIQEPDIIIFLHAPFDVVTKLREERKENDGIKNDIHEQDMEYMRKVYDNGMFISKYLGWKRIDCAKDGKMLPIEEIHEMIYQSIKNK